MNNYATIAAATLVATALAGLAGCAQPRLPDSPAESVLRAAGRLSDAAARRRLPAAVDDGTWDAIPPQRLRLYPQRSVAPGLAEAGPVDAELRSITDGRRLALRLDWPDANDDRYSTRHTDRFGDAVAVQFAPARDGAPLPYVGMGEPARPVTVWFWRAGRGTEALKARGFGTLEPDTEAAAPAVEAKRTAAGWAVVLSGPLPPGGNPLPIAVATWEGAEAGRDGRKHLSAWHLLRLPDRAPDERRLQALADESRVAGDPHLGERLVRERGCVACHHLPDGAASDQGPDLMLAGGLHWPGYLRRSVVEPSAFVVPHARYRNPDGGSLMPALRLPESEVEHIAAYLSSLR